MMGFILYEYFLNIDFIHNIVFIVYVTCKIFLHFYQICIFFYLDLSLLFKVCLVIPSNTAANDWLFPVF